MMHRLKLHKVLIQALSFSFDERYLASLGGQDDNTLVIWDVRNLLYYQIVLNRFKFYFFKYRLRAAKHLLEIQSA
jgi:WD40 repeat protein